MTTKICTIAEVPSGLEREWLQHLRDFDTAHPGCHFQVLMDSPDNDLTEMIDALRVNPALSVVEVFMRKKG